MAKKPASKKKQTRASAKPTAAKSTATRVTRIKANDAAPATKRTVSASKPAVKKPAVKLALKKPTLRKPRGIKLPAPLARVLGKVFGKPWGYLKGSWAELRMVRWPNRAATWRMTFALIAFTAFFTLVILLLDALFKYGFELIIKR